MESPEAAGGVLGRKRNTRIPIAMMMRGIESSTTLPQYANKYFSVRTTSALTCAVPQMSPQRQKRLQDMHPHCIDISITLLQCTNNCLSLCTASMLTRVVSQRSPQRQPEGRSAEAAQLTRAAA
eukprot:scaffold126379_cov15-Tisochrysis_lutea.AAC.1